MARSGAGAAVDARTGTSTGPAVVLGTVPEPGPAGLDRRTLAHLADLDPTLRALGDALPAADDRIRWAVHDVSWTPGSGARLAFHRASVVGTEFLAVRVGPDGSSRHDFREDRDLPGLATVADPTLLPDLLASALGRPVAHARVEPVRYRPGSRCVLRYDAQTDVGVQSCYAKVLDRRSFAELAHRLADLQQQPGWSRLAPRLLAVWPQHQTVVTAAASGTSAAALLVDARQPVAARAGLATRLGGLLSELHALTGLTQFRWTAEDQVAALRATGAALTLADPALGERLARLLDRLSARVPAPEGAVLTHGGFRAGQVVVGPDGGLTVLDVDGCSLSDRGRDLGTATAHLLWRAIRDPRLSHDLEDVEEALLAGYRRGAGGVTLESLPWWQAAGLLQVAVRRYRRLETADWPRVPVLVDAAERLLVDWPASGRATTGADLLDVRQMSTVIGPLLESGGTSPAATYVESARQLAAAEGRRTVVSYVLRGSPSTPTRSVVAKVFTDPAKAELLDRHLRLLHSGPFNGRGLLVPEPLGVAPGHGLVLLGHAPGVPLSALSDPDEASDGVRLAARWLAALHGSGVPLPRRLSVSHEAEVSLEWCAVVSRHHPGLQGRAEALARGWAAAVRDRHGVDRVVPVHKDFHAGHVLVGEEGICVVDLDEARLGDPALDLAHFCTYLQATGVVHGKELQRSFLDQYVAETGWTDEGTFHPFGAYTWLKIAKQRSLGTGPFPVVPLADRYAGVVRAIEEGERCLEQ